MIDNYQRNTVGNINFLFKKKKKIAEIFFIYN